MPIKLFSEKLINNKDDRAILADAAIDLNKNKCLAAPLYYWILANTIIKIIQILLNLRSIEVLESDSDDPELDKMLSEL